MFQKTTLMFLAVAALACASFAQDHPDFAGSWKLNSSKSNVGDYGPSVRTDVITQDGSKFTDKVTSSTQLGDANYTLVFTADGNKQTIAAGSPESNMGALTLFDITASWDGATLVVTTDSSYQGQVDVATKAVYSLSADGKTMTITSHTTPSGMAPFDTSYVFDKQ